VMSNGKLQMQSGFAAVSFRVGSWWGDWYVGAYAA
jgi:hypothetical protein